MTDRFTHSQAMINAYTQQLSPQTQAVCLAYRSGYSAAQQSRGPMKSREQISRRVYNTKRWNEYRDLMTFEEFMDSYTIGFNAYGTLKPAQNAKAKAAAKPITVETSVRDESTVPLTLNVDAMVEHIALVYAKAKELQELCRELRN